MIRSCLPILAVLSLAGCQPPVKVVDIDAARIQGTPPVSSNPCRFRLAGVTDGRAESDAGGLGLNQIKIGQAPELVRDALLKSGLLPGDATAGRDVQVSLRQLYLSQNRITKIPVVVYSVKAEGIPDFLVRAQPANMNWNGSENEALAAMSRAIHAANAQLMERLDQACRQ
jgi:hypothetical protein